MIQFPTKANPVKIIYADSFDIMNQMDDSSVDHVISDPPYAQKTHKGARTNKGVTSGSVELVDFDSIDSDTFLRICRESVRLAKRWVVMTCDWRHAALAEDALPDEFIRVGVWVKPNPAPQFTGDRPGMGWEAVLILHRSGKKRWNDGGRSATWRYNKTKDKLHPTGKPLGLVRQWVRQFTDVDDLIFDPFAGSCTTALAAISEGRRCLAVEKEHEYCMIGQKRCDGFLNTDRLIPYQPRKFASETLF